MDQEQPHTCFSLCVFAAQVDLEVRNPELVYMSSVFLVVRALLYTDLEVRSNRDDDCQGFRKAKVLCCLA